MVVGRVFEYLTKKQWIFDKSAAWDVQKVPQVQLATEGRLQTTLQEVVHPVVLLFMVQQGFCGHLVTAVAVVGVQTGQLRQRK